MVLEWQADRVRYDGDSPQSAELRRLAALYAGSHCACVGEVAPGSGLFEISVPRYRRARGPERRGDGTFCEGEHEHRMYATLIAAEPSARARFLAEADPEPARAVWSAAGDRERLVALGPAERDALVRWFDGLDANDPANRELAGRLAAQLEQAPHAEAVLRAVEAVPSFPGASLPRGAERPPALERG
jgi:hypothetical protein